ncbi:hypothetical protein ACQP2X_28775 [Actinoplanes sp. CA-131856]
MGERAGTVVVGGGAGPLLRSARLPTALDPAAHPTRAEMADRPGGWPAHRRGVSATVPGRGFVGLSWPNTFGLGFLGGMSGDAVHVVERLTPPA